MVQDFSQTPLLETQRGSGSFFRKYWRGDFSLAASTWFVGLALSVARVVAQFAIIVALFVVFHSRGLGLIAALLVLGAADTALAVWQIAGGWRATARYIGAGRSRAAAVVLALILTGFVLLASVIVLANIYNAVVAAAGRG